MKNVELSENLLQYKKTDLFKIEGYVRSKRTKELTLSHTLLFYIRNFYSSCKREDFVRLYIWKELGVSELTLSPKISDTLVILLHRHLKKETTPCILT